MDNWTKFGWALLVIGLITEAIIMGGLIWILSDMGYHFIAAVVTLIIGGFVFDQVHDYKETQE